MSKNKKLVPKRRFKEFQNSDAWEQRELGEVVQITMGQSPLGSNYTENPSDYILVQGNADMKNGKVFPRIWTTQVTKTAEPDDIILSVRAPVGDVGKTDYNVVLGRGVAGIKGNEFIYQLLSKMKSDSYWGKYSTGSTFDSINSNDLKEANICIPSTNEQVQIGSFFRNLDQTIAFQQRKLEKMKSMKSAYLSEMFPAEGERKPKRRFPGFTDDWEQCELGDVGKTQSGTGFPDSEQGGKIGVPFFKVSDMNNPGNEHEMLNSNNYVTTEQVSRRKWKPIDTVPAVIFAKVGAAIMLDRKRLVRESFLIDNNTMAYVFDNSWDVDFGKTLFETIPLPKYAQVGALPSYNGTDIETIKVLLPNKEEQNKIGIFFYQLDQTIAFQQQKLEKLQNIKKAYLNEMFI